MIWLPVHGNIDLASDAVDVWRADLDQPVGSLQRLAATLSPEELRRSERFHFDLDSNRFIAGCGILRDILARYLRILPQEVRFTYGSRGKPAVAQHQGDIRFNMSHSHATALIALSRSSEVGVDVECVTPIADLDLIAKRFFSPAEAAELRQLPKAKQLKAFLDCWTRKEAYLKATGDGLYRPTESFSVSLKPGEQARLVQVDGDAGEAARWSLIELFPSTDAVAALAVEGEGWHLRCWQWEENKDLPRAEDT